jgi:hypothetical protein
MTRHQPSGPGATGGLPGSNADPDVVQFAPDEAAATVAAGGVAPLTDDNQPTGTLAQTDERLSEDLTEVADDDGT